MSSALNIQIRGDTKTVVKSRTTERMKVNNLEIMFNKLSVIDSKYMQKYISHENLVYSISAVWEYVQGTCLSDYLYDRGCDTTDSDVIRWFRQLAGALSVLHANGVAHRDIKPDNIIIRPDGNACLIDFDSAIAIDFPNGMICRSVGYSSPEQMAYYDYCLSGGKNGGDVEKLRNIDWRKSDVYSLGASMYRVITGEFPSIDVDWTFVPELFANVLQKCMAFNPDVRFTADELRDTLKELV